MGPWLGSLHGIYIYIYKYRERERERERGERLCEEYGDFIEGLRMGCFEEL